jgi:hypothetical protein
VAACGQHDPQQRQEFFPLPLLWRMLEVHSDSFVSSHVFWSSKLTICFFLWQPACRKVASCTEQKAAIKSWHCHYIVHHNATDQSLHCPSFFLLSAGTGQTQNSHYSVLHVCFTCLWYATSSCLPHSTKTVLLQNSTLLFIGTVIQKATSAFGSLQKIIEDGGDLDISMEWEMYVHEAMQTPPTPNFHDSMIWLMISVAPHLKKLSLNHLNLIPSG